MMQMPQEFSCSTCDAAVPAALELSLDLLQGPKKITNIFTIITIDSPNGGFSLGKITDPTTNIASLGCNSLNFLVGADSSRGGVEDKGVSSTVGAPAAVSCRVWWILPGSLEKHQTDDQRIQ